jgi:hypothetical protein
MGGLVLGGVRAAILAAQPSCDGGAAAAALLPLT